MMHPTIAASLRGFMPPKKAKKTDHHSLVVIEFKGFTLTAEIDGDGDVVGIENEAGVDVTGTFSNLAIWEIESLVEAQCVENQHDEQFDLAADRAAERAECEA